MSANLVPAVAIFAVVYLAIITEAVNKTAAAIFGAMLMIIAGVIDQSAAFASIDWNVIFLLIGMMIITGISKKSGMFQWIAIKVAKIARGEPVAILVLLSIATAFISAFLDNVTTVLLIVPITFLIAVELDVTPVPFVVSLAIASNIGGTATLIGDPPNIMIGSAAGLGFMDFVVNLTPVILLILAAFGVFAVVVFRGKLAVSNERKARIMEFDESKAITDKPLMYKSLGVMALVTLGFLLHDTLDLQGATIALAGATVLIMVSGHKEVEELVSELEWTTILFFLGLFMLVGALVEVGLMGMMAKGLVSATGGNIRITSIVLLWASGVLSALVDNIPFVATMIPLIKEMGNSLGHTAIEPLWWMLSLGACLGGNGTLVGASANVVSAGISGKNGHPVTFWEFTKYGSIFTAISLVISSGYALLRWH